MPQKESSSMAGKTSAAPKAAGFTDAVAAPKTDPFARLKEPFPEDQTKPGEVQPDGYRGTVVEWNHVCDRIEEVDPLWYHWLDAKYIGPIGNKVIVEITCHLTILGVTRLGHSAGAATADNVAKVAKSTETDALKRAASKFGVARYLYGGSKEAAGFKLTEEQLAAVAANCGMPIDAASNWAMNRLGRPAPVDFDNDTFTAAELDLLLMPVAGVK